MIEKDGRQATEKVEIKNGMTRREIILEIGRAHV